MELIKNSDINEIRGSEVETDTHAYMTSNSVGQSVLRSPVMIHERNKVQFKEVKSNFPTSRVEEIEPVHPGIIRLNLSHDSDSHELIHKEEGKDNF
jgi:hypothetical protein